MSNDNEIRQLNEEIQETAHILYLQKTGDSKDTSTTLARGYLYKLIKQYCQLAILHQRDGKIDEAIEDYHNAIISGGSEEDFRRIVAECYVRSGFLRCQKDEPGKYYDARRD